MWRLAFWSRYLVLAAGLGVGLFALADDAPKQADEKAKGQEKRFPAPEGLQRLAPNYDIWIDKQRKLVIVDGKVVLREGQLEMFACNKGTKEHESIVAVNCNSQFVHAGLMVLGADPGHPVVFAPEYKPATGPEVEVLVLWKDEEGKQHKVRAQEWIQNIKTQKAMDYPWVFAGSQLMKDETSGKNYYLADGGDFICVSNFTSATLDLPVESSQANVDLTFRAFTEKIPPIGTAVRLVLKPTIKTDKPDGDKAKKEEKKPTDEKSKEGKPKEEKASDAEKK